MLSFREYILEAEETKSLEDSLKNLDWYYQYSDDKRVYDKGRIEFEKAISLFLSFYKKDKTRAISLWKKYAPQGMATPTEPSHVPKISNNDQMKTFISNLKKIPFDKPNTLDKFDDEIADILDAYLKMNAFQRDMANKKFHEFSKGKVKDRDGFLSFIRKK